jgi:hypothetical protein
MDNKFVLYKIKKCGCNKPQVTTSNDGNRYQVCLNCKWSWTAPDDNNTALIEKFPLKTNNTVEAIDTTPQVEQYIDYNAAVYW